MSLRRPLGFVLLAAIVCAIGLTGLAQSAFAPQPAFSLASRQIYTTKDQPAIDVSFSGLDHLDFRVYRVKDPRTFFASLKEAHALGSPEPVVPQERTWLERLAFWKAERRAAIRTFFRRLFSHQYRAERRREKDKVTVSQRQVLRKNAFAQMPLLNDAQVVTTWREMLPNVADMDHRRLPLELPGPGVYLVEAVLPPHRAYTIVVVSDIGLVTKVAPGQALFYAANRFTGDPVANCTTSLLINQQTAFGGTTNQDGVTVAELSVENPDTTIAVAQCGDQTVVDDPGSYSFQARKRELLGYVYTDKPIYRPGHTMKFRGIVRWRDLDAVVPYDRPDIEAAIVDPEEKVLWRQTVKVDRFGSVSGTFPVPASTALGYYTIRLTNGDETANGAFEVQEYRKPEFEVTVVPAERIVVQGQKATVTIKAKYYFGQPVARGAVTYALHKSSYYSPYRWMDSDEDPDSYDYAYYGDQIGEEQVRLNDQGEATVTVDLPVDEQNRRDYSVRIEARVTDASGREVTGKASVVAPYGEFMVVTRLDRFLYRPGQPVDVRVRAIDYQGQARASVPINIRLERSEYAGGMRQLETITSDTLTTDAEGRAQWKTTVPASGGRNYRIVAEASSHGRTVQGESGLWILSTEETEDVYGSDTYLELVADKKSYAAGDTARLMMRGFDADATLLVTKESRTISWHQVMRLKAGQSVDVPVVDADSGDTWVNVTFLKDNRLYRAEKRIAVPPVSRGLQISVTPAQQVSRPQDPGVFTVKTLDASGAPVSAEVSLAVVDEAVYAVRADDTADPVRFFYRRVYSQVSTSFSRDYSFIGYSGTRAMQVSLGAGRGGAARKPFTLADFKSEKEARPHVRKDFPDAIYWVADLVTDASGNATVKVTYPDALTTWRVTARGVTEDTRLGSALARTTTTKDVILRIVTPRFLTEGDTMRLPTVAHNYLPAAKTMTLGMTAKGLTPLDASATTPKTFDVAPNGESRAEWPYKASQVGTATVTGTLTTEGDGDAVELSLPVLPYGLKRETGQSGSILTPREHTLDLTIPEQSNPAARAIDVSLAPSVAGSLFGALDFLAGYPYGCTEQTISSFFPNLMVMRTLNDLQIAPTERLTLLNRMTANGLTRLYDLQHDDGGWGWWKTDENDPFMTAYAVWALTEAKALDQPVDQGRLQRGVDAAAGLYTKYPRAIPALKAYMVYVLSRAKAIKVQPSESDRQKYDPKAAVDELWSKRNDLTPYGRALLLLTLAAENDPRGDALAKTLADEAQTKGELSWWMSDSDPLLDDWSDTSVEATAFAVKALAPRLKQDLLLERAARYLLVNRNGGYFWTSTKQTAFALLGLLDHLRARGEKPATVTVDVEVNGAPAGSHTFTPADWTRATPVVFTVPGQAGANRVRLVTKQPGAVYWSATARYYDNRESLERTGSRTLALSRKYYSLTPVTVKGRIVYRETPFSGTANPGDLLLVRLTAAGSKDWRYLMLEDPIPAGAEAVRDEASYQLERRRRWWYGSQREYRDNRIVQFQQRFDDGKYEYEYLLKIVTPGSFRAMPAQIAPMYVPDVSATTTTQAVEVPSTLETAPAATPPTDPDPKAAPVKGGVQ